MTENEEINIYIISDSVGGTANTLGRAAMAQFPEVNANVSAYPFIRGEDTLVSILEKAHKDNALILHTLISNNLNDIVAKFCQEHKLFCFDILNPVVQEIEHRSHQQALKKPGALHQLDDSYFNRISAIEFAVKYDDGRDPNGFLEADIVILGISRTSKTPLSMFLANQNYKVANLPLVPEAHIPDLLWQVDPKKIVGLTNDRKILNSIRRERMIAYGLNPETAYSRIDRIDEELAFAKELYEKLGCLVINVATKSIEETAAIIVNTLEINHNKQDF
ncbi:MAG: pyruvate, water dikinase regulatory protein [Carnobacterium sp.]|uniref:Putative pyruvate, phosphate dikinase regulatory protein n=1 Tax=Carnobacterium antarcticum TaxID=2126436 RepID=A0ABW4NUA9_9LACT|nr:MULTISPECIES: pyruvate, water dikinase regulatory protein [unclassified Carnobacterium]ALV21194.1 ATP/GTP-binding protein [Carnobacterium sp. CP1]QQP71325.1 kinase/pyrophosphorylase [Carnobacterium sp. CS13]